MFDIVYVVSLAIVGVTQGPPVGSDDIIFHTLVQTPKIRRLILTCFITPENLAAAHKIRELSFRLSTENRSAVHGLYPLPPCSQPKALIKCNALLTGRWPPSTTLKTKCNFRPRLHVYFCGKKRPSSRLEGASSSWVPSSAVRRIPLQQTRRVTFGS